MRKFVHVGYPKSGSTSLQIDVFREHPEIYYLGRGYGDFTGYIDDDIQICAEIDLRFRREFEFDEALYRSRFDKHFDLAENSVEKKVVGFSSEFFSFTYQNDLDVAEKARRLWLGFGADTQVLIIIREQLGFIRSTYKEFIRSGYRKTFDEFVFWLYEQKDRNFYSVLKYEKMFELYSSLFGAENVHIVPFELLNSDPIRFLERVSVAIGVEIGKRELKNYNEAYPDATLELLRIYNAQTPYILSNDSFTGFQQVFAPAYYQKELGIPLPTKSVMDRELKNSLHLAAKRLSQGASGLVLNMTANQKVIDYFAAEYQRSNEKLAQMIDEDLSEYNYF